MLGQLIIMGLATGCLYSLVALAMVIIYKTSEILNFAQGELAMVSTFFAFALLTSFGLPFWAALPATLVFSTEASNAATKVLNSRTPKRVAATAASRGRRRDQFTRRSLLVGVTAETVRNSRYLCRSSAISTADR